MSTYIVIYLTQDSNKLYYYCFVINKYRYIFVGIFSFEKNSKNIGEKIFMQKERKGIVSSMQLD